jgi:PAS domain S-box-containing protein
MSDPSLSLTTGDSSEADPLLRTLIEVSPLAIYLLDRKGRVQLWNPAAERIFGWSAAEVLGRSDPTVAEADEEQALIASVIESGSPVAREVVRYARDGRTLGVALSIARVPDASGGLRGVMLVAADVTERMHLERDRDQRLELESIARAEAEAAERRARFLAESSALLDGSLDYHATLDNLAKLAVPNLADYCLIDELQGDSISRVAVAHADPERLKVLRRKNRQSLTADPEKHPVVRVIRTGESVFVEDVDEATLRAIAHGERHLALLRQLELSSFLVVPLGSCGKILGAMTLAYAESRRRYTLPDLRMAEELARRAGIAVEAARLYGESRRAVQARERLMAIVSHDLRNSLATVLLNASAIIDAPGSAGLDPAASDQLKWIARSAEQMNRLISDLLDVSAIELGRLSLDPAPCSVEKLLTDALLMFRPLAADKQIRILVDAPTGIPDIIVDSERLLQVLGNLVGNSIKFSPPGSRVRLVARSTDSDEIRLCVADEGPGIPEEAIPAIFEMYRQRSPGRRAGAGLGLGIARAIVEAHGGRIWVDSDVGAGASFSFTVPTRFEPGPARNEIGLL